MGVDINHNASGRAHCHICQQTIEKGALDVEFRAYHVNEHYHLHCIVRLASRPFPAEEHIIMPPTVAERRRRRREDIRRMHIEYQNNNEDRVR